MTADRHRFGPYVLDAGERRLTRDGTPVELTGRYFDALWLLVRDGGRLVTKERFFEEVWHGAPVTDEALTQCVRTLRRALGDKAVAPRYIQTVPKHGYRFIGAVEAVAGPAPLATPRADRTAWSRVLGGGLAGAMGGLAAGVIGGLFYGLVAASGAGPGMDAPVLALVCVTALVAAVGGTGVAAGVAWAAGTGLSRWWSPIAGACGGLLVGAAVKLVGLDAFALLFGRAPTAMTGAIEGLVLGGAIGVGALWAERATSHVGAALGSALAGGVAGALIPLAGGRLMGGSLMLLAGLFPGSRLSFNGIGTLLGEHGFGPRSQAVTGALEGALFATCLVLALARRRGTRHPALLRPLDPTA